MDSSSAPVQPPVSEPIDKTLLRMLLMDVYTGVSVVLLFATFLIVVTRFRLWHDNYFLKKIPELVNKPVYNMIIQALGFVALLQNQINDLYLIWIVILIIEYDNVFTISSYSLLERASDRWSREFGSLYNNIFSIVILIHRYRKGNHFQDQLLALLFLVLAKFLIRIMSYVFADRAYGLENINLVAEYMKSEHKLTHPSDATDPTSMKGYKYLVMGEEKIDSQIKAPYYSQEVDLKDDGIVTVERVWGCKKGLLHPSVDKNGGMKDVCLSFALFKLLRRRKFRYPAAEAQQPKTKQLIFNGLLSAKDKDRVFRVIKTELGFLRDLIFTRYPVGFAFGFPVWNLVLLVGILGVTLWFAIKVLNHKVNTVHYYLFVKNQEIDNPLTYTLLIVIILMELFEVFTYVFCDWAKVTMICQNVIRNSSVVTNQQASSDANSHEAQPWLFGYMVLALFCKPRYFLSIKDNLGQYSLLENCDKNYLCSSSRWYSLISTCGGSKIDAPPPGLKKGESVKLSPDVKEAIFDTLVQSRGDRTNDNANANAALQRNGAIVYEELKWTLDLETPVHIIMVWHVATCLCAIPLVNVGGNKDRKVATDLSNYCAYLVAFHPDLLPLTGNSVKYMFREIFDETRKFFGGVCSMDAKREKLMNSKDGDQKIIYRGSKLAHALIEKVPDYAQRWKLMADFWSGLILDIAPLGSIRAHIEQLSNGSEFITHLWALLYHAGIIHTSNEEYYS
ncbi:uncharacterized protein LOC144554565 [Carex rostrata]